MNIITGEYNILLFFPTSQQLTLMSAEQVLLLALEIDKSFKYHLGLQS